MPETEDEVASAQIPVAEPVEFDDLAMGVRAMQVAEMEAQAPAVVDPEDLPVRWTGAPTKGALKTLMKEFRTPAFDAERAYEILEAVREGQALSSVCRTPGFPRRGVVMAWRSMVPKFDELLTEAEMQLGGYFRDRATEVLEDENGDPARAKAMLAIAGAFDKRMAGRGGEGDGTTNVMVQINGEWK